MKFLIITVLILTLLSTFLNADIPKTFIGGYGELHFNNIYIDNNPTKRTLDFHRFVLFFAHTFNKLWSFKAELELEHNLVKDNNGELEIEQAYINFAPTRAFNLRIGVILLPIGLYNLEHEPSLFPSTERAIYAKLIIPTTWFANGISFYGSINDFKYSFTITEGLDGSKFSADKAIRDGRQKGYKADAESLLYSTAVSYNGIRGLKTGFSFTYNNAIVAPGEKNRTLIGEIHLQYRIKNFFLNAETAFINYDKPNLVDSSVQVRNVFAWYAEIGYNIASLLFGPTTLNLSPWFRYTDYNTAHDTLIGGNTESNYRNYVWQLGLSFKPISSIIFKIDYGITINAGTKIKTRELNFGTGYVF